MSLCGDGKVTLDLRKLGRYWRPVALTLCVAAVAVALGQVWVSARGARIWSWMTAALVLAVVGQYRLPLSETVPVMPARNATPWIRLLAGMLVVGGVLAWGLASAGLFLDWNKNFDRAWVAWLLGSAALASGLDVLWGCRSWGGCDGRCARREAWLVIGLLVVAGAYRLGNLAGFPGEAGVTQVEDLQTGNWGQAYLDGARTRWEFLSHAWLSAIGIVFLGPSLLSMRIPFAVVSVLKAVPVFLWLRYGVGTFAAIVGTALLTFSGWDVVLSRIPNNHNALVVAAAFALLAGPARRGRPSAYAFLGLFGGYVLYEYVAYRPLAFFALVGAFAVSLADRTTRWQLRLVRPLVTLALIVAMAFPLFASRLRGRVWPEYFNGWNRARANTTYYVPHDSWQEALQRRLRRVSEVGEVFYVTGDSSPVRNVSGWPLIDPVTGCLLLVGVGYSLANAFRPVFGLTLAAFLATLTGSLVLTGNLDVGRAGGCVVYVYVLAGYGAAGIVAAFQSGWGQRGRFLAVVLLFVAVFGAAVFNSVFLYRYWNSKAVAVALRSNLALLSQWLRGNVRDGERVVGIAPAYFNVLMPNDAAWLRGGEMEGEVTWDVAAALRYWEQYPTKVLLFVFAGEGTGAVRDYLEWLFPDVKMEWQGDPLGAGGEIAYAHLNAAPAALSEHVASLHCRGVKANFALVGVNGRVTKSFDAVLPFVDYSTWPGEVRDAVFRSSVPLTRIHATLEATFAVEKAGDYSFKLTSYAGRAEMFIDAQRQGGGGWVHVFLDSGSHAIKIQGWFEPVVVEPHLRLFWRAPKSRQEEIVPFYRITRADPGCEEGAEVGEGATPTAPESGEVHALTTIGSVSLLAGHVADTSG